jgi:Family of unknown function (DUF6069)
MMAHFPGTVVASEALHAHPGLQVYPLVTPGSPLALPRRRRGAFSKRAIAAAAAALVATAIMHLLLIATPRPQMFFTWTIGLTTVIAVVYPFSTTAPLSQKAATAVINLVLGAATGSLINGTAARVIR